MIKHYPRKTTPDLYSDELIDEIYEDLKLTTEDQRSDLKEYMEYSAIYYIESAKNKSVQLTRKQEDEKINQIANYLNKSIKILEDAANWSSFRTRLTLAENQAENSALTIPSQNKLVNYRLKDYKEAIIYIESMLKEMTDEKTLRYPNKNKTELVLHWLWRFCDFWDENSPINLSEGRYNDDQYESAAMPILMKMASPINNKITDSRYLIANSLLAEAIVKYRNYKKTEIPLDLEGYSQE